MRNRVIEYDLKLALAVLSWATRTREEGHRGPFLLDRNPWLRLKVPVEKSPRRAVITTREYRALRRVARGIHRDLDDALVAAHETGHRGSSWRQLSWQDLDWHEHLITWPGELDKEGNRHTSAMTPAFIRMVKARARRQGFDPTDPAAAGFIFPGPPHPKTKVVGPRVRGTFDGWFSDAERLAKLPPKPGRGWHSFRRKLATELRGESPQDVAAVMGWKSTRMLDVYQKAGDPAVQRALMRRRRLA